MVILVRFEYFSGMFCLNCLTLILSASPNMMHFVRTFSIMRAFVRLNIAIEEVRNYGKIVYIKNIFENDWWKDAYPSSYPLDPPRAIRYRDYQKSLAYYSHLAPLVLFFFIKRQEEVAHCPPPSPLNTILPTKEGTSRQANQTHWRLCMI